MEQLSVLQYLDSAGPKVTSYHDTFKRLYYHLYSNSNTSRAERIFDETAKLLLVKMLSEKGEFGEGLQRFRDKKATANEALAPILKERFPHIFPEQEGFVLDDATLRLGLSDLDGVALTDAPASVLGDAFQALIGPRLRGDKGQFFTPRAVVKSMVEVAQPRPEHKIIDPAAGTGGFLVEAHAYRKERFPRHRKFGAIVGVEKDRDLQRLGAAMLSLATDGLGHMHQGNSLDLERLKGLVPESPFGADIVLTNPPFGTKIGITEGSILRQFALGHNWSFSASEERWCLQESLRTSQDPQILFLDLCFQLLKPGGLVGIVLPEGVFGNRNSGYVLDYVRKCGAIEAMIDCPRTTFQPGTDTKTNVLFVRKYSEETPRSTTVSIAVAKYCGHDRRGRDVNSDGSPIRNDFERLGEAYPRKDPSYWTDCQLSDPYYIVPRYYAAQSHSTVRQFAAQWGGEVVLFKELVTQRALIIRKGNEVGAEAYGTGDIPFVRTSDISNWEVSLNPTNGVSEDIYHAYAKTQNLQPYDLLLVVDGRYKIGRTALLHPRDCRCVIQSHLRIITTTRKSPLDPFELLYILSRPEVLDEMRSLVFIQSTLGSIGKRLGELAVPVPKKTPEWNTRVQAFKHALMQRAELLRVLKEFETEEPEL